MPRPVLGRHCIGKSRPHVCVAEPSAPRCDLHGGAWAQLRRAGRWLWCAAWHNRVTLGVASLIWLIGRSGLQPRRMTYPCQQAAMANLGPLAVLILPAQLRDRLNRSHHPAARAARMATGAVTLSAVVLIAVGAAVTGYKALQAVYTPGNPACVAWTPADLAAPAELSARVLNPNAQEAVVAIQRDPAVTYGVEPYNPRKEPWSTDPTPIDPALPITAYELIWQAVADLGLGPYDNPLRDLVSDMDGDGTRRVLIKPNLVEFFATSVGVRNPAYSHPATIRPLVDMAARAGADVVWIGDGAEDATSPAVQEMINMGYSQAYINWLNAKWPACSVSWVDFHSRADWRWVNLGTGTGGGSAWVGSGYTAGQTAKGHDDNTYFATADTVGTPGPGMTNCVGWLAIQGYPLKADLIIDLAKLKVHYLTPNTAAIKNWVGLTMPSTYDSSTHFWSRLAHHRDGATNYELEFGNDMLWRELLDLHRAVLYWRNGQLRSTPQRRYLCVLDAIVAAQRYHVPSQPWPIALNTVLAGVDPVAVDAVGSRLQLYDFRRVPMINNAHARSVGSNWPIGTADPGRVRVVGGTDINATYNVRFAFDTAYDSGTSWPDWTALTITDTTPPVIDTASASPNGDGTWQVTATVSGAHTVFCYAGDEGTGIPRAYRLGRSGNSFTGTVAGPIANARIVAQDAYFNTSRADVLSSAALQLSTAALLQSSRFTLSADDQSFTLRNVGVGTMPFTATVDAAAQDWLSVTPAAGQADQNPLTLTVQYDPLNLLPGEYTGTITIDAPGAADSPAEVAVTLTVLAVWGDYDQDGDVDQDDFGHWQVCQTASGVAVTDPACLDARLDADNDVDDDDLAIWRACASGADIPASPACRP